MPTGTPHPGQRAHRPRLALAAGALAFAAALAGTPARADEALAEPEPLTLFQPFAMAFPLVPVEVQAGIDALQHACAEWPRPLPEAVGARSDPPFAVMDSRPPPPERGVCDFVANPEKSTSALLWMGGGIGAALLILGLLGFCLLRAVLLHVWHWRPQSNASLR